MPHQGWQLTTQGCTAQLVQQLHSLESIFFFLECSLAGVSRRQLSWPLTLPHDSVCLKLCLKGLYGLSTWEVRDLVNLSSFWDFFFFFCSRWIVHFLCVLPRSLWSTYIGQVVFRILFSWCSPSVPALTLFYRDSRTLRGGIWERYLDWVFQDLSLSACCFPWDSAFVPFCGRRKIRKALMCFPSGRYGWQASRNAPEDESCSKGIVLWHCKKRSVWSAGDRDREKGEAASGGQLQTWGETGGLNLEKNR